MIVLILNVAKERWRYIDGSYFFVIECIAIIAKD